MNFKDYINETYLAPYTTGRGKFYMLPRRLANNMTYDFRSVMGTIRRAEEYDSGAYVLCPFISFFKEDRVNISYNSKSPKKVIIMSDGKFVTNRGNLTSKFSMMSLNKAIKLSDSLDKFSYAVIEWETVYMEPFMLSKKVFEKVSLSEVMSTPITTYHLGVSRAFKEIANTDWCFADETVL